MDVLKGVEADVFPFTFQINHLAPHQTRRTRHRGQFPNDLEQTLRRHTRTAQGHHLKGSGQQGIPGEDRHGLAVHLVVGGSAATQVIVIHGGEVVMDQRHRVDHLQGHRRGHRRLCRATGQLTGRQTKNRP